VRLNRSFFVRRTEGGVMTKSLALTLAVFLGAAAIHASADWPQWQRPDRNRISKELSDQAGYASAIAADVQGVRTYMTLTANAGVGVRASDGKLMFRFPRSVMAGCMCAIRTRCSSTTSRPPHDEATGRRHQRGPLSAGAAGNLTRRRDLAETRT
jgi:hypothetical protein